MLKIEKVWLHLRVLPTSVFNRRWWWSTLVVVVGMVMLARLGFWQLNRLEQRRARNDYIRHQLELPPLSLNEDIALPDDLTDLKIRQATAIGEFDFEHQVVLKYQNWQGRPGVHLITPFVIENSSQTVLVDRGWIPQDDADPEYWAKFDEAGMITVEGFIALSETAPLSSQSQQISATVTEKTPQQEWYRVDIEAIQTQLPYPLYPIYLRRIQADIPPDQLPQPTRTQFDLSDGPHMGYAIQWFIFAAILGGGYLYFISKQEIEKLKIKN